MSKESDCHNEGISGNCGDTCPARRRDCAFSIEHSGDRFTLEYCDGYYIESVDAQQVVDLSNSHDADFAHFVVDALNEAWRKAHPVHAPLFPDARAAAIGGEK